MDVFYAPCKARVVGQSHVCKGNDQLTALGMERGGGEKKKKTRQIMFPTTKQVLFLHLLLERWHEFLSSHDTIREYHIFHCDGGKCGQPFFLHQTKKTNLMQQERVQPHKPVPYGDVMVKSFLHSNCNGNVDRNRRQQDHSHTHTYNLTHVCAQKWFL